MSAAPYRLDVVGPKRVERAALVDLLERLDSHDWARPTECPQWSVHGIAVHLLGDDLSFLSRQRDGVPSGLLAYAGEHPGLGFLEVLHGFNERWVETGAFLSSRIVVELLRSDRRADRDLLRRGRS